MQESHSKIRDIMTNAERIVAYRNVMLSLIKAQMMLDNLAIGDYTTTPSKLKHSLDEPIEQIRAYTLLLYLEDEK
jgi:hypothetical protein